MRLLATIPVRADSVANVREHWSKRARRAKAHRLMAWAQLRALKPSGVILGPVVVTLTRVAPRALDGDNLAHSLKAVRDGVADWLQVDDRESAMLAWRYAQRRGAPKTYAVEVEVAW